MDNFNSQYRPDRDNLVNHPRAPSLAGRFSMPIPSSLPVPSTTQQPFPNAMRIGGSPPFIPQPHPIPSSSSNPNGRYFEERYPSAEAAETLMDRSFHHPGDESLVLRSAEEGWIRDSRNRRSQSDRMLPPNSTQRALHIYEESRRSFDESVFPSPLSQSVDIPDVSDGMSMGTSRSPSAASSGYHDYGHVHLQSTSNVQHSVGPSFLHPSSSFQTQRAGSQQGTG
ncbi:hypothetical protein NM688_g9430 [Phlebia brevispora]|uniref:Uncharacterized protein n=1 Tax=Phlebia brevispora TaxID=194682 RepID=A0ACC1RHM8_9APHY|nr:hypothetical protein NM688_g9430 [Phlebia brevispora]